MGDWQSPSFQAPSLGVYIFDRGSVYMYSVRGSVYGFDLCNRANVDAVGLTLCVWMCVGVGECAGLWGCGCMYVSRGVAYV